MVVVCLVFKKPLELFPKVAELSYACIGCMTDLASPILPSFWHCYSYFSCFNKNKEAPIVVFISILLMAKILNIIFLLICQYTFSLVK